MVNILIATGPGARPGGGPGPSSESPAPPVMNNNPGLAALAERTPIGPTTIRRHRRLCLEGRCELPWCPGRPLATASSTPAAAGIPASA